MRILQVASLVTPDGAYGGPIRVAVNQTRALLETGHDVTFVSGASGFDKQLPTMFDGVPVKLFPARKLVPRMGFATLSAPKLYRYLSSELHNYDIVHLHMARDLVTLPLASLARRYNIPYVVQPHGMIVHSKHLLAAPLDAFWTKKALLGAKNVLHLTAAERAGIQLVSARVDNFQELPNGVPTHEIPPAKENEIIEVLFMARLHAVKRPDLFVKMAARIHEEFPSVRFRLVGPDEGEGNRIQKLIDESKMGTYVIWEGALEPSKTLLRMSRAAVYVLPSERDAFPMSVLEAMSLGIPVLVTSGCGLAEDVERNQTGAVTEVSVDSIVAALRPIVKSREYREALGRNGKKLATEKFGMGAIASQLEDIYKNAVDKEGRTD